MKGVTMLLVLVLAPVEIALAQGVVDAWYARSPKPQGFEAPKSLAGKVQIELPRNWQLVPGYGEVVFTAADRFRNNVSPAAIVLERVQLQATLAPSDITDALAQAEVRVMQERQPEVKDFQHELKQAGDRRYILIQYSRAGLSGRDRVVQYSIPTGNVMYRLICVAPEAQLIPTYQSLFAHVAASFKPS